MEKLLGQTLYGKISKYMDNLCEIRIRKGIDLSDYIIEAIEMGLEITAVRK